MAPGTEEAQNARERAVMEGLRKLAKQAEIVEVSGWVHPYGWLLDPQDISRTILRFLGELPERLRNDRSA